MPLFYLLPLITFIVFVISLFIFKKKDKYLIFVSLTGLVFSAVEAFIIYKQYGLDNGIILNNLFYFVVIIILNSLNCIFKMKLFINNKGISFGDFFSVVGLILFIIKFIAK